MNWRETKTKKSVLWIRELERLYSNTCQHLEAKKRNFHVYILTYQVCAKKSGNKSATTEKKN